MTGLLAYSPDGAAWLGRWGLRLMEIILHLGAHRTGTTTFQHYLRRHQGWLKGQGIAVWAPPFTRKSVLPGLFQDHQAQRRKSSQRVAGRIGLLLHRAEARGARQLLISDENLMGSCVENLREASLYPSATRRAERLAEVLRGQVGKVLLTIRPQEDWWASAAALTVSRGHRVPDQDQLETIARSRRGWREVIQDVTRAMPAAQCLISPFEGVAGRPDLILSSAVGGAVPTPAPDAWHNRSASAAELRNVLKDQGRDPARISTSQGRWQPFTPAHSAQLRETYLDDLHWLHAGADGLASLTCNTADLKETQSPGQTGRQRTRT